MKAPQPVRLEEDYAIVTVRELDPPLSAAELQDAVDLVPLLSHEMRPLSAAARARCCATPTRTTWTTWWW
jgi:hypothetical protein